MALTVLCHPSPWLLFQQWQLWEEVAGRESGAGQQMELAAAASGRAGGEDTATGGAPQAHPLYQGKTKILCNHVSLEEWCNVPTCSQEFSQAIMQVIFVQGQPVFAYLPLKKMSST